MKLIRVSLPARDPRTVATYFRDVLDLPTTESAGSATVRVGRTQLRFVEDPEFVSSHHLAFTVPENLLAQAKSWIRARTNLLGTESDDEFECFPSWNARSVYFEGPESAVLEFIIRRDLNNAAEGPFTSSRILGVSEVGVAVTDVPAVTSRLSSDAGIAPYGVPPVDTFAPVGSIDGLLILVSPNRTWFPTTDLKAGSVHTIIEATGGTPGRYTLSEVAELTITA